MDERLVQFVERARAKGMDYGTIRQLLVSAGWKERDVADVFCGSDLELPVPAPATIGAARPRGGPGSVWPRRARDALLHLLTFGAFYTWVTSLILLYFTYIDFAFPDPAWRASHARVAEMLSVVRAQMAIVIVAFPVFLVFWHYLLREVRRDPERARAATRRSLAYLSIFVGALTLAGDIITLIYFLLEGQLTVRLVLKAGVLFLIAGGLVLYLALTMRGETPVEAGR